MRNLPLIVFLFQIILSTSCNAPTSNLENSQPSQKEDSSNLTSVKKTKLSDTIFLGFRFGMSLKEAKRQAEELKSKGEQINLSTEGNRLVGSYLLNNGKYNAKSKLTLSFVNNKLSDLQIYIHGRKRRTVNRTGRATTEGRSEACPVNSKQTGLE